MSQAFFEVIDSETPASVDDFMLAQVMMQQGCTAADIRNQFAESSSVPTHAGNLLTIITNEEGNVTSLVLCAAERREPPSMKMVKVVAFASRDDQAARDVSQHLISFWDADDQIVVIRFNREALSGSAGEAIREHEGVSKGGSYTICRPPRRG